MTQFSPSHFKSPIVAVVVFAAALGVAYPAQTHAQELGTSDTYNEAAYDIENIGRSGAMRAPLNIVPPIMQSVLEPKKTRQKKAEKLAPRVAARQSKRAVRAVAAAPGSTGDIVQIGQLGALQDAPIGLEDGFGRDLWRGARLAFITAQMARLPDTISMAALREAELTLYRSTTASPVGTVDGTSWYAARLNRFLALGDTGSVLTLEQLAGGAAQDAYAAKAVALANLGSGDAAAACALPRPQRGTRGHSDMLSFFMQLLVYCQLSAGEFEKAGLTLQLNEKTFAQDKFFRDLAFLMAAQAQPSFGTRDEAEAAKQADEEPPLIVPSEVSPMQLALLQLAGYGTRVGLDKLPPYFMAALAKDYAQPTATQLGAAHLAMRAGTLSSERFSQMSQLADLSAYQSASAVMPNGVFLAKAVLKVDVAAGEDQAQVLASALRAAQERGLWLDMVQVLEDRLRALATLLNSGGLNSADAAPILASHDAAVLLPAYLALSDSELPQAFQASATEFETRLVAYAQINAAADPLGDLLARLPNNNLPADGTENSNDVFAPADNEAVFSDESEEGEAAPADTRLHPIADWTAFEAAYESANAATQRYLSRELAVYQGLGFDVPQGFQMAQPTDDTTRMRMDKLADNKWVGDLVLSLVNNHAASPADGISDAALIDLLRALRRAGLNETAQAIGAEILHHAAARLSLSAPQAVQ